MSADAAHANHVYESTSRSSAIASSPIVASWRRCMVMHGLAPEDRRTPIVLSDTELGQSREAAHDLISESADELDRIFSTVGRSGCCVLLTDAEGVALDRRGAPGDDAEFRKAGLWSGALWSEASVGTNGIGTALTDERAVIIYRDQHFLSCNIDLCCTTAPIRDHRGQVTGALDISTCRDDINELTFSMVTQAVRDAAQRIEGNLFRRAFPGARILVVPSGHASALSLLAIDQDDIILGATRAARLSLGLDDTGIAQGIPASDALKEERHDKGSDLAEAERAALRRVLSRSNGNITQAAAHLGISRATLHRKMKRLAVH